MLYVYVVFRLCRCEKTSWWALTEDSLPNTFGESAKGLFRLVGDSAFNCVSVCMRVCVCDFMCVHVGLIFPKNLAEMLIVFLLLDRKSIPAED